jgi:hypothetical protein
VCVTQTEVTPLIGSRCRGSASPPPCCKSAIEMPSCSLLGAAKAEERRGDAATWC